MKDKDIYVFCNMARPHKVFYQYYYKHYIIFSNADISTQDAIARFRITRIKLQ